MKKLIFLVSAFFCFLFINVNDSLSTVSQAPITQIVIEGNKRIEPETILSYLTLQQGDLFDPAKINSSLKNLYGSHLFGDVSIVQKGSVLVVSVIENPIINRVAFEGNLRVESSILEKETGIIPRMVYSRHKVQEAQQKILQIYRLSGRYGAKVHPKIIELPENRLDLVFEIDEGPLTQVQKIIFVGNNAFSDSTLEAAIQTKESRWYRFFTTDDTYDPDRLNYDQEKLRQFYLNHGYADFQVLSAVAELTPDQKDFFITFTIQEGERYNFGTSTIESAIPAVTPVMLEAALAYSEGDLYEAKLIDDTVQKMVEIAGEKGFAFASPHMKAHKNREEKTVDLTYELREGNKIYIERIDIVGNHRTLDSVIRRELMVSEGDAFNIVRVRKSLQNIKDLDYFKKADIVKDAGSRPDTVVLKVEVEEKSTGELSFAGGYGQYIGALGEIGFKERNVMGTGQEIGMKTRLAQKQTVFDVNYLQPYFLGKKLQFGVDAFMKKENMQDMSSYDQKSTGAGFFFGYDLGQNLSQVIGYSLMGDRVSHIPSGASIFVRQQPRRSTGSIVYQTLTYDKRDSRLEPTMGYVLSLTNEYAGVGGTLRYLKNTVGGAKYYALADEVVLVSRAKAGYMAGLGKTTRIADRFMLGGETLRGFDFAGVSPRDRTGYQDALGGMKFYAATIETLFPIGLPNEFGVKGSVFMDAGSVWDSQQRSPLIYDCNSPRVSAGFGLSWKSPLGPLRLDFGWPLIKKPLDKTRVFLFGFSTRF